MKRKIVEPEKKAFLPMDEEEQELMSLDLSTFPRFSKKEKQLRTLSKKAAKDYNKKDKSISVRLSEHDLVMLKIKAGKLGLPYHSIIASLIHQYVNN